MKPNFTGPSPAMAASKVVAAIRECDWVLLAEMLDSNQSAVGELAPWLRLEGPPTIADDPEVEEISDLMSRYPGRTLVRYDTPDEPRLYKLEVVVEPFAGGFTCIDFWGLGW